MPFTAYKLLALRAELAARLGEPGAASMRARARAQVDQIAIAIDDALLEASFLRVADGWLQAPLGLQRPSRAH